MDAESRERLAVGEVEVPEGGISSLPWRLGVGD
jgi:hypothetical protein